MEFILYKIDSADNVINKDISNGYTMQIKLKSETDLVRPIILLKTIENIDFNDFNYCHIPLLKRYYFIHNVYNVNANMWRLQCGCDVLESYKADILASHARLKRNIRTGDLFDAVVDTSIVKSVSLHKSNITIGNESTLILSTVGV